MEFFKQYIKEEDGGITIEWVALAAGVALLAIGIINALDQPLQEAAEEIANDLGTYSATIGAEVAAGGA